MPSRAKWAPITMTRSAPTRRPISPQSQAPRVLFARVGRMKFYAGPQTGDEKPIGGGGNNKKHIGHEIFNFADFHGRLYGFVSTKKGRINFERIDPAARDREKLDDVLIIFVAGQRIIGWYRSATAYRTTRPFPISVSKEITKRLKQEGTNVNFKVEGYRFESSTDNAVLLPTHERRHEIPGNVKGGFGQSNVCYLRPSEGKRKSRPWMDRAISYVMEYAKENLLKNPSAEMDPEESAAISQEQSAGFQSNPAIRKKIEEFAMLTARAVLKKKGYGNFSNTAQLKPYDYTCTRGGNSFFVEVKGTQTLGRTVILTRGEVDHVRNSSDPSILVLVHSVIVSGKKHVHVSGGTIEVRESWTLRPEDLNPIQYLWKVHSS